MPIARKKWTYEIIQKFNDISIFTNFIQNALVFHIVKLQECATLSLKDCNFKGTKF